MLTAGPSVLRASPAADNTAGQGRLGELVILMQRRSAATNYAINIAGLILPLFVMAVTVPVFVRTVGDVRYGALSIIWLLLGYFGFLDLGLTRASENALAKAAASGLAGERGSILVTAFVLNTGLGLLGAVILFAAGEYLFENIVSVSNSMRHEIRSAMPWVAALFPLALVSGVLGGALDSQERFLASNTLSGTGVAIGQVVPVICAIFISPSLAVVVPAAVLVRAMSIMVSLVFVYCHERPLHLLNFHYPTARRLLGYGGWVTVSGIVSPILASLDQFVIGSQVGIAAVTYYAVPMNLVPRGQIFAAAMSRTLFPSLSRLDIADARRLGERATNVLALSFAVLCAPAIIVVRSVLSVWMGPDFALKAAPVAEILLFGAWINGVAFIPYGFLQAQGRPDLPAKFHTTEVLPFIGVLWLATSHYGLVGAAAAWTLRVAVDAALMIAAARFSIATALRLLLPACCVLGCYTLATCISLNFVTAWLFAICIGCGMGSMSLAVDAPMRDIVRQMLKRLRTGTNAQNSIGS